MAVVLKIFEHYTVTCTGEALDGLMANVCFELKCICVKFQACITKAKLVHLCMYVYVEASLLNSAVVMKL